jgi:YidC/Oxa1 family membrane protein insertase
LEDRRLLYFFVASIAILLGWNLLMPSPPPRRPPEPVATPAPSAATTPGQATPPAVAEATPTVAAAVRPPRAAAAEREVVLEDDAVRAVLSNRGAQLRSFVLKEHFDASKRPLELVRRRQQGPWPLGLVGPDLTPSPLDGALFAVTEDRDAEGRQRVRFEYAGPHGAATKVVTLLGEGLLAVDVEASPAGWGLVLGPGIRNPSASELGEAALPRQAVYRSDGEVEVLAAGKSEGIERIRGAGLSWAGVEDNYFLTALAPETRVTEVVLQPVTVEPGPAGKPFRLTPFADEEALAEATAELPRDLAVVIRPEGERLTGTAYFGAKEYERLAALPFGFEETLNWGFFGFLARPLLWGLLWLHDNVVANYGWAIALLTLGIRLLLFPLTWTSQKSMMKMQVLQPRMQAIREKYRGKLRDKKGRMDLEVQRKMNEEMQEMFRSEGANPYGGCLPMLAQIPVFFALFSMLQRAVELRGAPWLLWVNDLSEPDRLFLGSSYFITILPLLMGATQFYQMQMTPMSGDPMQRRMMQLFPWIFTAFSFAFPSGLVLYWTVNNVITIGQTAAFLRYKKRDEAKKALAAKRAKADKVSERRALRPGDKGGN